MIQSMKYNNVKEVEIELTGLCNLHCPLCARNNTHYKHLRKYNERPLKEITDQIDQFINMELFYIAGTSSEPTMYHDFFDLIRYTKGRGIRIELFTNGNTHNAAWWKELSGLLDSDDQVYFAVCGETQELHEKYRIGSNLQEILDNAEAFRSNKNNDILQFIRLEYNRDSINTIGFEAMLKPFKELFLVDSDIKRSRRNYVRDMPKDVMPFKERQDKIRALLDIAPAPGCGNIDPLCLEQGSIFIDQFGKIFGCYAYAKEVGKVPLKEDDEGIDFTPIINFENEVCAKCDRKIRGLVDKLELEYIY